MKNIFSNQKLNNFASQVPWYPNEAKVVFPHKTATIDCLSNLFPDTSAIFLYIKTYRFRFIQKNHLRFILFSVNFFSSKSQLFQSSRHCIFSAIKMLSYLSQNASGCSFSYPSKTSYLLFPDATWTVLPLPLINDLLLLMTLLTFLNPNYMRS